MRLIIIVPLTVLAMACSNKVDPDPQWYLGTFSTAEEVDGEETAGGMFKITLKEDGSGPYVGLDCEGDDILGAFRWELEDDSVRLIAPADQERFVEPPSRPSPFTILLHRSNECSAIGMQSLQGDVHYFPTDPEESETMTFFRSNPCSGSRIPPEYCEPGLECDGVGECNVEWCDDGEPEPCE